MGASRDVALAIDIGGTKLAAGLVDGAGQIIWSVRAATPTTTDPEVVWSVLEGLLRAVPPGSATVGCGVGCGGPMGVGGERVSPLNIPAWRDFPLCGRVVTSTGLATWVDNDAKALTLAEGWCGGAVGQRNYLSMVVSTGIGAGLVVDGRLLDGFSGNAGHLGHVTVVPDGRRCACGAQGCLEAEASGTAIEAITGRLPQRAGTEIVDRTGRLVGQAVASAANLLDIRLATVAGSVALGFGAPFFAAAQAELEARACLDFSVGCRIVPSSLVGNGPLIGAAALVFRGLGRLHPGEAEQS